jgi:hypothetical protein
LLKSRLQLQQAKSSERRADWKVDHQQRIHLKPPTITTQDVDEKFTRGAARQCGVAGFKRRSSMTAPRPR